MTPEQFIAWREAFGGRRFMMTLGSGVINSILLWFAKLDSTAYTTLIMGTVAAYIAAGTLEKVKANALTNTES